MGRGGRTSRPSTSLKSGEECASLTASLCSRVLSDKTLLALAPPPLGHCVAAQLMSSFTAAVVKILVMVNVLTWGLGEASTV